MNRITESYLKDKIAKIEYKYQDHLTVCVVTMVNGFMAVGSSAPADPTNYDKTLGEQYAYENAFRQLWSLEGYQLCSKLTGK